MTATPPVCDYEGSDYRTRFWENQNRDYEDRTERVALRRLLPAQGQTLLDIGAGFGRLAGEYGGYQQVVLMDYSRSLLREAQAHWGDDPRIYYVAADWYRLPFRPQVFDTLVQVRTMHHAADVPALLAGLANICRPGGSYVLEFANKRNLKAILRYGLRRQTWSPFTPEPIEFAALNFDFHPDYMQAQLVQHGFQPGKRLAVSYFRVGFLKRWLPTGLLVRLDGWLQPTGRWLTYAPSVFVRSQRTGAAAAPPSAGLFACPHCQTPLPPPADGVCQCPAPACQRRWAAADRFYDFKEPLSA